MPSLSKRNQPSSGDDLESSSTSSGRPVCESSNAVSILLKQIALSHISELTEDEAGSELEYQEDQGSNKSEVDNESMKLVDDHDSIAEVKEPKQAAKRPVKYVKPTHPKWSTNEETIEESDDDADGELITDMQNDILLSYIFHCNRR